MRRMSSQVTNPSWLDPTHPYPANEQAYVPLLNRLAAANARSIVEIGVGAGRAIPVLAEAGLTVAGCDLESDHVESSRARLRECAQDPERIVVGDIRDLTSLAELPDKGAFDALLSLGVLPHVDDEVSTLVNMRSLVRPGGEVFIEFRNALFSLITFNRYTYSFIVDDLLSDIGPQMREVVERGVAAHVRMDVPSTMGSGRFHVPFEVTDLLLRAGFVEPQIIPFHYHAGMPWLEADAPELFRAESLTLEYETSGWKGLFLCSAFLVHAIVPDDDPR